MRRKIIAAMAPAIFLAGAMLMVAGCTQSQLRKALILFRDFAVSLDHAKDMLDVAVKDGQLSQAELDENVKPYFRQLADANDEAINAVLVLKSKPGAVAATKKAIEALDRLNNEGLLHIKNAERRVAVQIAFASLRTALATAQALLQ